MIRRQVYAVDLVDDERCAAEYERIHRPGAIDHAVIADMRAHGYVNLTIWRSGSRLFMLAETVPVDTQPEPCPEAREILEKWEALTSQLQQALPGHESTSRWIELKQIFDLAEHATG